MHTSDRPPVITFPFPERRRLFVQLDHRHHRASAKRQQSIKQGGFSSLAALAAQAATDYTCPCLALPCRHYLWPLPATETAAVQRVHSLPLTWLRRRWRTQCGYSECLGEIRRSELHYKKFDVTSSEERLHLNCDCILWCKAPLGEEAARNSLQQIGRVWAAATHRRVVKSFLAPRACSPESYF